MAMATTPDRIRFMSVYNMTLNKLLKLYSLDDKKTITALREDIRAEVRKEKGLDSDGGDFYVPFWSDAKDHVAGKLDLGEQTKVRVSDNPRRAHLYPRLATGFLTWWLEKRRWSNLDFQFVAKSVNGHVDFADLNAHIRVGGLMSLKVGDESFRLIYPYFCKDSALQPETARIGLWLMQKALGNYPVDDMRILDVMRAKSFAVLDCPLQGNEAELFAAHFHRLTQKWNDLRTEYPPFAA